uniref:EGF-like domain-containing protein n=1 Tax=Callorhinchus milii TaxID=7868 RepID=A0A4W3GL41_CALMI
FGGGSDCLCDCLSLSVLPCRHRKAVCELPCANGGKCTGPNTCQCPSDYTGEQFNPLTVPHRVNTLSLSVCLAATCTPPCLNRGRCIDVNKCFCPRGWRGARCQVAVVEPCVPRCQHGATCGPFNQCQCPEGTAGHRCERL